MKKYKHLDDLLISFRNRESIIQSRLKEFQSVPQKKYFYELLYCLMTPQSSAVNAGKAQKKFELANFQNIEFDPIQILFDKEHYIRFHRTKAKHILEMKEHFSEILPVLISEQSATEKREWLVKNVNGLSYKEATHFLRNIGKNEGLTILDRHILKNLRHHGVINTLPKSLTKKIYFSIEKKFLKFAAEIGISGDELDLVFWSNETGEILK